MTIDMERPRVSIIIPAQNEGVALMETVTSIVRTRAGSYPVEIILVDDASTDGSCGAVLERQSVWAARGVKVIAERLPEPVGIPAARNHGAAIARGQYLFSTDAHVQFPSAWDEILRVNVREQAVLSAGVADPKSGFAGYGCDLEFPSMGTRWIMRRPRRHRYVPIAPCSGTVVSSKLFWRIGGYDARMPLYGAAEPEFSVRVWLSGATIKVLPELLLLHRFRSRAQQQRVLDHARDTLVQNSLRFALMYLPRTLALEVLRYYTIRYPTQSAWAFEALQANEVWYVRKRLAASLKYDFLWLARRFALRDASGRPLEGNAA